MRRIHTFMSTFKAVAVSMLFALVVTFLAASGLKAQTDATTGLDGFTPAAMQPGTPAGSYALSGFDTIDLYSGSLNFRLPLVHVQGRGDAQMTMILPFHQKWIIVETQVPDAQGRLIPVFTPKFDWWIGVPAYSPGFLASRSSGSAPQTCFSNGLVLFSATLTRLTFTAADGTEFELHDLLHGGQPQVIDCVTQQSPREGRFS